MKKLFYFYIIFIVLVLCTACTKLPPSHLKYIGMWSSGSDYEIVIRPNGYGSFKTKSVSGNSPITATEQGFKIGLGPFQRVYIINQEPYQDQNGNTFFIANNLTYKKKHYTEIDSILEVEVKTQNLEEAENTKIDLKYIETMGILQNKKSNECADSVLYSKYIGHWVSDTGDILIVFPNCVSFFKGTGYSFNGNTMNIDTQNKQLKFALEIKSFEAKNPTDELIAQKVLKMVNTAIPSMAINQEPIENTMILDNIQFHKLPTSDEFPIKTKVVLELK